MDRRTFIKDIFKISNLLLFSQINNNLKNINLLEKKLLFYKHEFKNKKDYLDSGAPFIYSNLNDWIEDKKTFYGSSPYNGAFLDLIIDSENRPFHLMMNQHSGMVKALMQNNINIPFVNTFLHFDSHNDIQPLNIYGWNNVLIENNNINKKISYGNWLNYFIYFKKFKEIIHIADKKIPFHDSYKIKTLYVLEKENNKEKEFGILFNNVPKNLENKIINKVEWIEYVLDETDFLNKKIKNNSWAFSICNDYFVPNYKHVRKYSPCDIAPPIKIPNDLMPLIKKLKCLHPPLYGATNIAPNYTASPNSFLASKFIEKTLFNYWNNYK